MKRLTDFFYHYLGFSQNEARAFVVLQLVLVSFLVVPSLYRYFSFEPVLIDSQVQQELDTWLAQLQDKEKSLYVSQNQHIEQGKDAAKENKLVSTLTFFNPNTLTLEQWQELGLPQYLAARILKYRSKGGKFTKAEDLKKIYGFPEVLYQRLVPFVLIDKKIENTKSVQNIDNQVFVNEKQISSPKIATFDINTVDTLQLIDLQGIGSITAQRIIKFRDKLGGFHSLEQLKEVWGIQPQALEMLALYARLNSSHKHLNINTISYEALREHPYLTSKQASLIINYRKQHGNYQNFEDLLKIKALKEEDLLKVKPYLHFE